MLKLPNGTSADWRYLPCGQYFGHGEETRTAAADEWNVYKVAAKATWLGTVEAPDAATAIEKAAAEFNVDMWRLLAVARREW